jgi:hypothetical protein
MSSMQGFGPICFWANNFFFKKKIVTNDTSLTQLQPRYGWENSRRGFLS